MLMFVRHLAAIVALPFTMAVLVPLWIVRRYGSAPVGGLPAMASQLAGVVALAIGLVLFAASVRYFAVQGRGTLAPWDPPKALVVAGPYRYVRNPMISGVRFILGGEALVLVSRPLALWTLAFLCVNLVYIPLMEEPLLDERFGEAYREYCREVRRIVPRTRPWEPGGRRGTSDRA